MNERPTREPLLRPRRPPPSLRVPLPQTKLLPWPRPPIPARLALARTGPPASPGLQTGPRSRAPGAAEAHPTARCSQIGERWQRGSLRALSEGNQEPEGALGKVTSTPRPARPPCGRCVSLGPRGLSPPATGASVHLASRPTPKPAGVRPRGLVRAPLTCQAHTIHPRSFPGPCSEIPRPPLDPPTLNSPRPRPAVPGAGGGRTLPQRRRRWRRLRRGLQREEPSGPECAGSRGRGGADGGGADPPQPCAPSRRAPPPDPARACASPGPAPGPLPTGALAPRGPRRPP